MSKYTPQVFIELIPKESTCSIVISECAVIVKDEEVPKTKVLDLQKLCNFVVHNVFI